MMISELQQASKQRIEDHQAEINHASNSVADDDPSGFQGNKSIDAYPPAAAEGSVTMDRRPSWAKPSNESGGSRKRMLTNMRRIGHAW
jgi:hypothetical protein